MLKWSKNISENDFSHFKFTDPLNSICGHHRDPGTLREELNCCSRSSLVAYVMSLPGKAEQWGQAPAEEDSRM